MKRTVAGLFVALGLVITACGDGSASNEGTETTTTTVATTTVAAGTSTSLVPRPTSIVVDPAEPAVPVDTIAGAVPDESQAVDAPPEAAPPEAAPAGDAPAARPVPNPNPFNCVGEICPNPYTDAPAPDPNADPRNPQIVWCGTDKYVHDRGATVWDDGTWSPWSQHCADEFDAVNNPPNPPGTMGGGGAVSGPCRPEEEDMITFTPDMRKQQCTGGQWVFIR